jgi:sugar porter (SP) family MFS transporter
MDYGLISGLQAMPGFLAVFGYKDPSLAGGYGISSLVQQLINSLMTVGAFVASFSVGPLGIFVGRRWALFIACILNHVGAILMIVSTDLAALYASRVIIGLANGLFMVETQLYIQEASAPQFRGVAMGVYQICIAIGSIIGSIVDNYTSARLDKSAYQIPCGCLFIIPTFLAFVLPFLPETPRWLVAHGRHEDARQALKRLRPSTTDQQLLEAELHEIIEMTRAEESQSSNKLVDMFRGTNRRRSALSLCLVVSLSATGNLFFVVYGTYFFQIAGSTDSFAETVGMNCAGLAGVLLSLYLITIWGRRTILLLGAGTQATCMLVIGAIASSDSSTSSAGNKAVVAFVILHIFFYTMFTAPYLYLAAGEMPSNNLRGFTLGVASSLGFLAAWVISFTVPYFINPTDLNWVRITHFIPF